MPPLAPLSPSPGQASAMAATAGTSPFFSVLKLDAGGLPVGWIGWQTAAVLYARDRVVWDCGESRLTLRGGTRADGAQSRLDIGSIVAVADRSRRFGAGAPLLSNTTLFRRDSQLCLYCGQHFPATLLTRDHVMPLSRGGLDAWENCVTACQRCNQSKDARTPDEARMPLLAVPYAPNLAEYLILQNRKILTDQMAFLARFARRMPGLSAH